MQEILYEDSPYLVTAYTTIGEAFRSDRFACFQPQPDPGGILLFQYGVHNYLNMRPADEAGDCDGVEPRRSPAASDARRLGGDGRRGQHRRCWSGSAWPPASRSSAGGVRR